MTVVLLHPIGLDGDSWQFLTTAPQAVRYTMLWHGGRARPTQPLSLHAFAEDVVRHVQGPLDVVGLSMGGAVAMEVALRWPDRVRSLLVACATAGGDGGRAALDHAVAVEKSGMAGILDTTLRRWFSPSSLRDPDMPGLAYARRRLLADPPESFAASWRALAANNALAELADIQAPTTVFHATGDASGPLESRRVIADGIPRSRLVTAPGPHMIQLEDPARFDRVIEEHLAWAAVAADPATH